MAPTIGPCRKGGVCRPRVSKSLVVSVGLVLSCAMRSRYFASSEVSSAGKWVNDLQVPVSVP